MNQLFIGIVIGLCIGLGGMFFSTHYYHKILVDKAEKPNRTPEKILGKFYYIVPEDEYAQMEWAYTSRMRY